MIVFRDTLFITVKIRRETDERLATCLYSYTNCFWLIDWLITDLIIMKMFAMTSESQFSDCTYVMRSSSNYGISSSGSNENTALPASERCCMGCLSQTSSVTADEPRLDLSSKRTLDSRRTEHRDTNDATCPSRPLRPRRHSVFSKLACWNELFVLPSSIEYSGPVK